MLRLYIYCALALNGAMQFFRHFLSVMIILALPFLAGAQEGVDQTDLTAQFLEDRIAAIEAQTDLSGEESEQAISALNNALGRLSDATRLSERRLQFINAAENAQDSRDEIEAALVDLRANLENELAPMVQPNSEAELFDLEQQLIAKQSELAELTARLEGIDDTISTLLTRQTSAPNELAEARTALSDVLNRLVNLGEGDLETVSAAQRLELQANAWYRRNQIRTLEQEISTLAVRQELLNNRRAVTDLEAQLILREEIRLADQTGERRIRAARNLRDTIAADADALSDHHPLIAQYAQTNLKIANEMAVLSGVELDPSDGVTFQMREETPPMTAQRTATVRGELTTIENNLIAAQKLVDGGRLDREAGEVLRRLGRQLRSSASIRADIRNSSDALTLALRRQIIAQEDLRALPVGAFAIDIAMESAKTESTIAVLPDLSPEDRATLNGVLETRRDLLQQHITHATARINAVTELETVQRDLLSKTESLQTLLDENLLWVRSVPAVDGMFPKKVLEGTVEFFSVDNFRLAIFELFNQVIRYFFVFIGFLVVVFSLFRLRPKLVEDVERRGKLVGRVQEDSAWHSPAVILSGFLHVLPVTLIFLLLALLYNLSERPEDLITGLAKGFVLLALVHFIFSLWRQWDRKKGLFETHFRLPRDLRQTIARNLRWFAPLLAIFAFILGITSEVNSVTITEGLAVFIFSLTGLAMAFIAFRVIWRKTERATDLAPIDGLLTRFRGPLTLFIIGLPLTSVGLALMGYFESAEEFLWCMFMSGVLVLLTYIAYQTIRRAIVVAQRQIKYRQALERREAELQARRELEEAEEKGEELPPIPIVDLSDLDVTTITRQTSQLLQTATFLSFAGLFWLIWSSLIPALTIFDGFEIWSYNTGRIIDGLEEAVSVSLWDILQSIVILTLTFIAARNLPGFLEIFVLNRVGVDAGIRYAVTTILGYLIIAAGIIIAFDQLGLQWSQLRWIVTGLSVGIGFGLQKIIANFISGLIILFERPIRIGDYVTIGEQSGTVSRIKIRATTLRDLDNREILIPNEALISERVTNWTLSSSVTRLIVPVGIAYGSDTDAAREIILDAVKEIPKVLSRPSPQVLFLGFGESSLDFEIRLFLNNFEDRFPIQHAIHTEVNKALEAAGISIPFPQRDMNIVGLDKSLDIQSKTVSKQGKAKGSKTSPKSKPKS